MSRSGNPYDNACIESFFSHFKTEWIYPYDFRIVKELTQRIQVYITYYHLERRQKKWKKKSPVDLPLIILHENIVLSLLMYVLLFPVKILRQIAMLRYLGQQISKKLLLDQVRSIQLGKAN